MAQQLRWDLSVLTFHGFIIFIFTGDFAIYLKNGMSKRQGLGMNFLAACFAFIGLYVGLSVGANEEARQWMLALVAGMFLYISLVDVVSYFGGSYQHVCLINKQTAIRQQSIILLRALT